MKNFKIMVLLTCVTLPVWGWGASKTSFPSRPNPLLNSNMHGLNLQIRKQMVQIRKGLKSGKLTRDEAKAQMTQLKTIRQQELQYFHQNGQKEITSDQKNHLQQQLNQMENPSQN